MKAGKQWATRDESDTSKQVLGSVLVFMSSTAHKEIVLERSELAKLRLASSKALV
jgi:hypothetical protein